MEDIKVPNKYKERFLKLELDLYLDSEMGKYILHYADGWGYPMGYEGWRTIPCRSKKEAIEFLKQAVRIDEDGNILNK